MSKIRFTTVRNAGLSLAVLLSVSTFATSSSFAFSAEAQSACSSDAFRLCAGDIPSIPKITACIRRNKSSLSSGCRMVLDKEDGAANRSKVATTRG
jgi:hypothetical protein